MLIISRVSAKPSRFAAQYRYAPRHACALMLSVPCQFLLVTVLSLPRAAWLLPSDLQMVTVGRLCPLGFLTQISRHEVTVSGESSLSTWACEFSLCRGSAAGDQFSCGFSPRRGPLRGESAYAPPINTWHGPSAPFLTDAYLSPHPKAWVKPVLPPGLQGRGCPFTPFPSGGPWIWHLTPQAT